MFYCIIEFYFLITQQSREQQLPWPRLLNKPQMLYRSVQSRFHFNNKQFLNLRESMQQCVSHSCYMSIPGHVIQLIVVSQGYEVIKTTFLCVLL